MSESGFKDPLSFDSLRDSFKQGRQDARDIGGALGAVGTLIVGGFYAALFLASSPVTILLRCRMGVVGAIFQGVGAYLGVGLYAWMFKASPFAGVFPVWLIVGQNVALLHAVLAIVRLFRPGQGPHVHRSHPGIPWPPIRWCIARCVPPKLLRSNFVVPLLEPAFMVLVGCVVLLAEWIATLAGAEGRACLGKLFFMAAFAVVLQLFMATVNRATARQTMRDQELEQQAASENFTTGQPTARPRDIDGVAGLGG